MSLAGVRALLDQHWVKTGKLPTRYGRIYRGLFQRRHRGDYSDMVVFAQDDVRAWLQDAEEFVVEVTDRVDQRLRSGSDEADGAAST